MLKFALLIINKDLHIALTRGCGIIQSLLLGLLLLFVFSLSKSAGELTTPNEASAIFWLCSVFSQTLVFNQLYSIEEDNSCRECLLLSPLPLQGIWLGKAITGLLLLLILQIVFLPAAIIFLNQSISSQYWSGIASLLLADIGICESGALLGSVSQGQSARESLISIILFPLLIPLLLAAISIGANVFGTQNSIATQNWLGLEIAFDAIFLAAGLVLSGFLYSGGD